MNHRLSELIKYLHITGIDKEEVVEKGVEENLINVHVCLKSCLPGYAIRRLTRYSLQFSWQNIEIDLLLSPNWKSKEEFYDYLEHLKKSGQKDKLNMY